MLHMSFENLTEMSIRARNNLEKEFNRNSVIRLYRDELKDS